MRTSENETKLVNEILVLQWNQAGQCVKGNSEEAINYFREAIRYIRKDSPQNADKVKKEILEKISELSKRPEIHPPSQTETLPNKLSFF